MSTKILVSLVSIGIVYLLALSVTGADAAVRVDATGRRTDTGSDRTDSSNRTTSSSNSSSKVRSQDDVRSTRSAHSHTRTDHVINKATAMGLTKSSTDDSRMAVLSTSDKDSGEVQNLVVTASNDSNSGSGGVEQGGNAGIGDGSGVSLNAPATISDLSSQMKTFTLRQGTAFIAHPRPIRIKTVQGNVIIAPHSAVYIVASGKSVAIHNIADHKANDVTLRLPSSKTIGIKSGQQILLTGQENQEYDKANPVPEIKASRTKEMGTDLETKIFNSEVSPIAVLDHAQGFHDLVNSKNKDDLALADHILKTAAIVLNLRSSDQ